MAQPPFEAYNTSMTALRANEHDASATRRLATKRATKERQPCFRAEMSERARGMYTRAQAAEILGISPAAIDKRRQRRHLLAVPYDTGIRYPAAQFRDGKVVAGLTPILEAFGGMDPWGQLQLLVAPIEGFSEDPRFILDLLAHGMEDSRYQHLISLVKGRAD